MNQKLFGTSGVRKIWGTEFGLEMAMKLGRSLGTYLRTGSVLIARDARTTGPAVEDAIVAGLLSTGINVARAGMIPTPTLAFMTKHGGYEAGVMVTASHNPPEYTGVKFWSSNSMGYTPEAEKEIERIYHSGEFIVAQWDSLGSVSLLDNAVEEHIKNIIAKCDVDAIRDKAFKIIVDPGNGAACVLTPYLMRQLGCNVITINGQPDGHFPGRESEPDETTLGDLIHLVKDTGADLGIAHDGDSDRVVFVTENGEVIRGDRTIALLSRKVLKSSENKIIITTVDSSKVLDETVEKSGGETIRTPVGDIQVAVKVLETAAALGGEACGVFILPDFHLAPEPFLAASLVLELMAKTGRSFGHLISEIPVYPLLKAKVNCSNEKKPLVMKALVELLPKKLKDTSDVLTVDGIGLTLSDGWVLVRPSGTEPVIRVTCEASAEEKVTDILMIAKNVVEKAVESF